ncbi:unnamed protein product [Rhizoctonia solani]|uniref:PNPLA domain-containing protein n=1 Tax=Rhizoctonia solani TaxID=456999 RepID=A0A8H3HU05_9AGAM|nr:unnamed protein product [Rhizoctonia solani]
MPDDTSKGLNILCLDGGGVRGLSSLVILREMMRRIQNTKAINIHPHEHFDIIAGTGTGGISACMLGRLQMPVDEAIAAYVKLAEDVFRKKKWNGPTMYKGTKLREALKAMVRETTGNETEMMIMGRASEGCKAVVFAMARHHLNARLPVMFRSYSVPTNPGPDCSIIEALYATMAHPDLFKSIDIVDSGIPQSFVGGEIGCSNPLTHVLSEAKRLYPDRHVACIISIGAGHARTIQVPEPSRWFPTRTQDMVVVKDMATDSEVVAEDVALRFQGRSGVYFRFNVDQGMHNMKSGSWEKLGEATQHTKAYLQKNDTDQKLNEAVGASMERREAVSTIQAAGQIGAAKRLAGFKRCPASTPFYTGRGVENAKVIACITGGKHERRVCVVYGLGGVGTTQLVLNVIERTWDEWDHIIYADASSNEALEKSLQDFAEAKGLGKSYKDMISWLESCGERWLVVFDNADTRAPSTNIRQYIPARGRGGSVLITTRLPELTTLAVGPGSVCHLSSMSPADGAALLVKITSSRNQCLSDEDTEAAGELVKEFGYLALAIVHAGAFIAHSSMPIAKYRSLFLSQRRRMLEEHKHLPEVAKLDERGDTVYTTWRMCYDQLKPESREMLWLIAYLHYDGISEEVFKRASQNMHSKTYPLPPTNAETHSRVYAQQYLSGFIDSDRRWDAVQFARVMDDLTSYSLIQFDRTNLTYRVHVLVHDWAKTVVPHSPKLAIERTATVLSLSIGREEDAESLAFKRQLGLHVTSVLKHNPDLGANHTDYLAEVYSCTGQWDQKAKIEQKLIAVFRRELGNNDIQTWSAVERLASSYQALGKWDKALDLQTRVSNAYKELLGEEHPSTLSSMGELASSYSGLGRYIDAQQLHVQVLDLRKRVLGNNHLDTLSSMNNLALTYSRLGRYIDAQQLQVQVLDLRKRLLGEEHPDTLTSMNNLALTYSRLGRYIDAQQLHAKVLDLRKHVLGGEHPSTLASMNNLALMYSHLGRYIDTQRLHVQVLDLRKRVLGERHPDTLCSMNNLALTYSNMGRYNDAKQLHVQVLGLRKRVLGKEHPDTLASMHNLASTYSGLGQYNNARQLQIQVLDLRNRVLGEKHPDTLTSMNNLAMTYSDLGRYDYAQQLHAQVLDLRKRVLGKKHPSTLSSMSNLASTYSSLNRWEEAKELYRKAISIAERTHGSQHPSTKLYRRGLRSVLAAEMRNQ